MAHTPLFQRLQQTVRVVAEAHQSNRPVEAVLESRAARTTSRRQFLGGVAGAAAGSLVLPALRPGAFAQAAPRVAIVGAGLAGLTCAFRLRQAGVPATVYEAADRLGGRCWTRRGDFTQGQIAEHGGELIDQAHTRIRHLAQELRLPLDNLLAAEANGTEPFYFFDGAAYSYRDATNDMKGIWQKLHRDLSQASYPTLYNNSTQRGRELDAMSILDWINETVPGGVTSRLGQLLDVAYNIEYGAESGEQSALNLLYLLGYSGQGQLRLFGPSNEKYHVRGGNDQIVAGLADALTGQIVISAALTALALNADGGYTLTFGRGRGASTVTVDKVVLALPFSILRSVVDTSRAGFNEIKRIAIAEQGMGANTKLNVQFHSRHWRTLGANGDSFSDTGYQATWEVTRGQAGTAGILVDYTGGTIARSFDKGTVAARAGQFLGQLEPVLPGITPNWNGRATLDYWPGNPLSRGSYSFWKVGQYTRFAGAEGEQSGNCHFAGEHTSVDAQGYLEGAVETGERAAAEVLGDLGVR